ncbi:LuxR C-terminal-related transcriptional regulator [Paenibacillus sp.]|uniref:LuxR C-terminal-related transcriptional regulator n=1 Tax=Paenibacillus sp. TaxID=58172 RepID=UPI002D5E2E53|nr:LuxR C-terminal-related transcriptional regulator [Paenibacillus sp.]HZG88343.1 LuxR C-terminal-related transcriptional regulator [Paenibacillus sp.]
MFRVVPDLLHSFQQRLSTTFAASVVLADKQGRHRTPPVYRDELSKLVFEATLGGAEWSHALRLSDRRPALIDGPVPGLRYAAVAVPAPNQDVYAILCGVIADEPSLSAARAYVSGEGAEDAERWLSALDGAEVWTREKADELLQGMSWLEQTFARLTEAGESVITYKHLGELLANAAVTNELHEGDAVEGLVRLFDAVDFAGLAVPEGDVYRIVEYSGPCKDRWLRAVFVNGEGFLGQASMLEQPRSWKSIEGDPRVSYFREKGIAPSCLAVYPMMSDAGPLGMLFCGSTAKQELGEPLERYIQALSYLLGKKIEYEKLKNKEQHYATQLAAIVEISKIMSMAGDLKKALYVMVDISLILLAPAIYSHLIIQLPGADKAQIVSRGMRPEEVHRYSKSAMERYFPSDGRTALEEIRIQTEVGGECLLVCPIVVQSELYGILSVKLPSVERYEPIKDIFSTFVFLFGITLERIVSAERKEGIRGQARMLHEATKVWSPEAYEKAERTKELAADFADEMRLSPAEKEDLSVACILSVYPEDFLRDQLRNDPLLGIVCRSTDAAGEARGRSTAGQILALVIAYVESGERIEDVAPVEAEEELKRRFAAFLTRRLTVDFELPAISRKDAALEPIGFEALKQTVKLSARELDVLELMVKGHSNREIGEALYISEHTVKNHITNIFHKLEVSDRAQAIAKIYQLGYQK